MHAELPHLRSFFEVARQRSFTRAAQILRAQQPGMSRSVRLLEEQLGIALIERGGGRFELTPAGERVYASCARIFAEVADVQRIAEEARGDIRGPLRIGASGILASRTLPDALPSVLERHPRLWPTILSAPAAVGMSRIADGELELGLYFYTPPMPATLACVALAQVEFRLVIRGDRAHDPRARASFLGSREVEDPRATSLPTLDRLRRQHADAAIRISTNDAEAHLRLVHAGLGCSILPAFVVDEHPALVDVFPGERFRFPMFLVTRRHHVLSAGAKLLLDEVLGAIAA